MRRLRLLVLMGCVVWLAGCRHKAATLVVPPTAPEIAPVMVSVPPPTHPTEPLPAATVPVAEGHAPVVPPPKRPHKHKAAPAPPVQVAVVAPPPAAAAAPAIALGQLSAGGDAGSGLRAETETMLAVQMQRLDRLPTAVAAAHAADVEQARRFLKGADEAWKTGDVEGAHTLVVKAKVLLDDLR